MKYYIDSRIQIFSCVEEIKSHIDYHTTNNPFVVSYSNGYRLCKVELVVKEYADGKALVFDDGRYEDYIKKVEK